MKNSSNSGEAAPQGAGRGRQAARAPRPVVGIIMGSASDWPTMQAAAGVCGEFGVAFESRVVSAHRTPLEMVDYARGALDAGLRVIIAGAGGSAHLPGMVASLTTLPVIGVPVESRQLKGMDSLLSIVQMPPGVPVATVAIGGARNAGILAVQILAGHDPALRDQLAAFKERLARESRARAAAAGLGTDPRPSPPGS